MNILQGYQESGSCWKKVFQGRVFLLVVAITALIPGCDLTEKSISPVAMSIGDRDISADVLKRDLQRMGQELGMAEKDAGAVLDPLLERLVDRYLILEYGRQMGISISKEDVERAVAEIKQDYQEDDFQEMLLKGYLSYDEWEKGLRDRLLTEKIIASVSEGVGPVTFKEIKAYFNVHREEFSYPRRIKFRQIVTNSREEAEEVLKRIEKGEDFGGLARRYSCAPEAGDGGEMGWMAEDALEDSMAKALLAQSPGQIGPIVETPYGFHIFEVLSEQPAGTKTLPEARPEIQRRLFNERRAVFYRHWLAQLRTRYPVKINRELVTKLVNTMELG